MTDYNELVKALRCGQIVAATENDCKNCPYFIGGVCAWTICMSDAAAAIEALEEDNADLNETVSSLIGMLKSFGEEPIQVGKAGNKYTLNEPKLGEWQKAKPKGVVTYSDGYAECSHCHEAIWLGWGMNFCPNCGTQNRIIDPDDYDGAKMEVQDGQ